MLKRSDVFRFHFQLVGNRLESLAMERLHFSLFDASNCFCAKLRFEVLAPQASLLSQTSE